LLPEPGRRVGARTELLSATTSFASMGVSKVSIGEWTDEIGVRLLAV
jgi:hypothetical protein